MTIPPPPQDNATQRSQTTLEGHVTKDNVLDTETYHKSLFIQLLQGHFSTVISNVAWQFACGERKVAYCCVFGLAEHFKKLLQEA